MKEKIKELRIKIDGLAQLVEHLHPQRFFKIDIATIPEGWTVTNFIEYFKESGFGITDSRQLLTDGNLAPAIQEVPQQFKEVEKAKDSLYLAKAWLGKILQELGEQTPYQNDGKRKEVDDIEKSSDKFKIPELIQVRNNKVFSDLNYIEKVDWLREEINMTVKEVFNLKLDLQHSSNIYNSAEPGIKIAIASTNSYNYLSEARFWLGFELERIKKQDATRKESGNN